MASKNKPLFAQPGDLVKKYVPKPQDRILILTEGESSEPKYLAAFIAKFGLPQDRITVRRPADYTPLSLLSNPITEVTGF